jgi:hypothetical protein
MDRITHQSPRQQGYRTTSSLRNDSLKHTQKHERREGGIEPRSKAARLWRTVSQEGRTVRTGHADSLARCRRQSTRATRTVRPGAADSPLKPTEPPETNREKWTVRENQADCPRGIRTVRYWSSDRPQTSCNENLKQIRIENKGEQEHDEHAKNWAEQAPRGQSAERGRTVRQVKQSRKISSSRSELHQLITGNPKRFKFLRQYLGEMLCTPRWDYTPKISSPNPPNHRESRITRAQVQLTSSSKESRI